ncbi:uncharacterized protein LOC119096761 [Pollicipes pollicipes]|uniref:uncharacterized protein LOC119096761 n=1 Tax=Pollicipes pollicipes TaxID=41117 RepID=UPI001884B8B1|nr:uncharacterized protein LOC119096761 [Pollicipes pollicipes]
MEKRQTMLLPGLANHPAVGRLDLRFWGSGSESQISRDPLGCGFPVVGDHPWLVALGFTGPDGRIVFSCSGALISDQHVVTSARCALGTRGYTLSTVRLGEYDFSSRRDCVWYDPTLRTEARDVAVHSLTVHPDFVNRQRSTTTHVMDEEKLAVYNTSYYGPEPCQYRLLSEADGEPNRCLGSGTPCFGSAFFLMGVASMPPTQKESCLPGA